MSDECAGCMSDEVVEADCGAECPISEEHVHLFCIDCRFGWTEN